MDGHPDAAGPGQSSCLWHPGLAALYLRVQRTLHPTRQRAADTYAYLEAHVYPDVDTDDDADGAGGHSHRDLHGHLDADAHAYLDSNAYSDANQNAVAHTHPDPVTDRDQDTEANGDG